MVNALQAFLQILKKVFDIVDYDIFIKKARIN